MNKNWRLILLRVLLGGAGLGWAVSVLGVFLPWPVAVRWLQDFGHAAALPDDPMCNYWLRMAAGAFTLVGVLFLAAALRPQRYRTLIPLLALLSLLEGAVLLTYGLVLHLAPMPFAADVAICLIPGIGILVLGKHIPPAA